MNDVPTTNRRPKTLAAAFLTAFTAATLALAAAAFACTPSNMVTLTTTSGAAGTNVGMTGTVLAPSDVVVHWNGADGPVLAKATPAELRQGAVRFSVPDVAPGFYVVTAVQTGPTGGKLLARASFQVLGAGGESASPFSGPAVAPAPAQDAAGSDSTVGLAVAGLALGFSGLALVGGAGLVMGRARRRPVPAEVVSTRD